MKLEDRSEHQALTTSLENGIGSTGSGAWDVHIRTREKAQAHAARRQAAKEIMSISTVHIEVKVLYYGMKSLSFGRQHDNVFANPAPQGWCEFFREGQTSTLRLLYENTVGVLLPKSPTSLFSNHQ